MFRYISKLNKKPESYRKKMRLVLSISGSILIFLVWVSVAYYGSFRQTVVAVDSPSPFESLRASAVEGLESLQKQFNNFKSDLGAISETIYEAASTTYMELATSTSPATTSTTTF